MYEETTSVITEDEVNNLAGPEMLSQVESMLEIFLDPETSDGNRRIAHAFLEFWAQAQGFDTGDGNVATMKFICGCLP